MALGWLGRGALTAAAVVVALLLGALAAAPLAAQTQTDLQPQGSDGTTDRYRVTLGQGATLWDVADTRLPLVTLDQDDQAAYRLVLQSFQAAFPGRDPGALQPGDSFTLSVPAGTFVAESQDRQGGSVVYRAFSGDRLTYEPRNPVVLYRLAPAASPSKVQVRLAAQQGDPVDLAKQIYGVDPPDFIQVRTVEGALSTPTARLTVDENRRYLDDFRNYRRRAATVEEGKDGLKVYQFAAADKDIPFVRVEDAVGDSSDPGTFPPLWRRAFFRDGTVRLYRVSQSGDTLDALAQPDTDAWRAVLPAVQEWHAGAVEELPPFTPAVDTRGRLQPGLLLVLRFDPVRPQDEASLGYLKDSSPQSATSCAGLPLALIGGGWGLRLWGRKRRGAE